MESACPDVLCPPPARPSLRSVASLPHIAFERTPGIAWRPLPPGWRRREPDKTALHIVVRDNLQTFLAEGRRRFDSGTGYPAFVEHEFSRYLTCGMLPWGFSRLRCPACGLEKIVAFSCKGRMCPSCWARRTADTAAHLVDRVLPEARYRQWVLTFPWELRYHLATDRTFLSEALRVFMRTLFAWLRLRGRRLGIPDGRPGSVTGIQRFGGILNLNPHFHAIVPDGLFVPASSDTDASGSLVFVSLPPPTDKEFADLAVRLAARLSALARRRFQQAEVELPGLDADTLPLRTSAAESVRVPGQRTRTSEESQESGRTMLPDKPLCSRINGFSLHAARVVEPDDRAGLERLARYCLRAPYSLDRLSLTADGMVRYRLHRPWPTPTGRTEILLDPLAFMRRLAALLPAPYVNLVRYHGVFANRSKCRARLPPPPVQVHGAPTGPPPVAGTDPIAAPAVPALDTTDACEGKGATAPASTPATATTLSRRPRRLSWASLLKRVLDVDSSDDEPPDGPGRLHNPAHRPRTARPPP